LWKFSWTVIKSNEGSNDWRQGHLKRVDVIKACQEHHTVHSTGVWQFTVGCTGLVTTQYSPDDWKLGAVGIGFLPLVYLTCSSKMLKYCLAGIWEEEKLDMNKITGKAVGRQPAEGEAFAC